MFRPQVQQSGPWPATAMSMPASGACASGGMPGAMGMPASTMCMPNMGMVPPPSNQPPLQGLPSMQANNCQCQPNWGAMASPGPQQQPQWQAIQQSAVRQAQMIQPTLPGPSYNFTGPPQSICLGNCPSSQCTPSNNGYYQQQANMNPQANMNQPVNMNNICTQQQQQQQQQHHQGPSAPIQQGTYMLNSNVGKKLSRKK